MCERQTTSKTSDDWISNQFDITREIFFFLAGRKNSLVLASDTNPVPKCCARKERKKRERERRRKTLEFDPDICCKSKCLLHRPLVSFLPLSLIYPLIPSSLY
jgi:hypothetical protein